MANDIKHLLKTNKANKQTNTQTNKQKPLHHTKSHKLPDKLCTRIAYYYNALKKIKPFFES